jgi:hypothetical protein
MANRNKKTRASTNDAAGGRRAAEIGLFGQSDHIFGLKTLVAFGDGEFHRFIFLQRLKTVALNGAEMHEDIGAAVTAFEKTIALASVEPFDFSLHPIRHYRLLIESSPSRRAMRMSPGIVA